MMFSVVFLFQGVCIPPEVEQVDREGGTEFEEAEGGGFDEGLGTKNVSNEVDADILVRYLNSTVFSLFSFIGRNSTAKI